MPIGRRICGDLPRRAAGDWHDVDPRFVVFRRVIADGEIVTVRRDAMVVVAVDLSAGSDDRRFGRSKCETANRTILIEDKEGAIVGPVWGFKVRRGCVLYVTVGGSDRDGFQCADENAFSGRGGHRLQADI